MKETRTEEEIKTLKEKRKEEAKKMKQERKRELEEAEKRRKRQSEAAEETAIKLGKKKSSFNPYYLMFGGLFVALVYIIVMLFMNRQTPLNKIPVIADAKRLMSTSFASHSNLNKCFVDGAEEIPPSYDFREVNKACKSKVKDQHKRCAASYAVVTASTLSERNCLENPGNELHELSAQELLSCDTANKGCRGGYVNNALEYTVMRGLVSEECLPYKGTFDAKCSDMCSEPIKVRPDSFCVLFEKY